MSKSIIPPTGDFGRNWPANFNLPQGASGLISAAGWTYGNEGFIQQTFLGASIRSLSINAGFGDTASTLSVQLVEDEYNKSDETGLGLGDDVYHNGVRDNFIPPAVGSPVFFKFGKTFATVEQAWRPLFDEIYNRPTLDSDYVVSFVTKSEIPSPLDPELYLDLEQTDRAANTYVFAKQPNLVNDKYSGDTYLPPNTTARGRQHVVFGGILQSYIENKGPDGNPLYSAQVVDPREILSNAVVILNNYAGSVFNNKNYFNVYGFLEYDPSDQLLSDFAAISQPGFNVGSVESAANWVQSLPFGGTVKTDNRLEKVLDRSTGQVFYFGNDMYRFNPFPFSTSTYPEYFPMTGQGFSRISDQGIPWYRVRQGLNALFNYNGFLPSEYVDKGFGGPINFRGYNYVVDFTGIPIESIPQMYFLNFDQIDLLSLCQELCDVISHDLFVSLLPIINHPSCQFLYEYNKYYSLADPSKIIAGVIRVDAINRSDAPRIGAIKEYLDSLEAKGIHVESQDLGYELSNVVTDKMVAGAQEVEMYYFNNNKDRDNLEFRRMVAGIPNNYETIQETQWSLETSLKQQILPFYGFLGKDVPTIPIGFGAYQQIMLDTSDLDAYGVGNYYIATEMELRAALTSYEDWSRFLVQYNESFIEELGDNQVFWKSLQTLAPNNFPGGVPKEFGVSVPRCLFTSDKNYVDENGYPASPCSPPYGYPLYYKRAERIGIPEAGVLFYQDGIYEAISKYNRLKEQARSKDELLVTRNAMLFNTEQLRASMRSAIWSNDQEQIKKIMAAEFELNKLQEQIRIAEQSSEESIVIRNTLESNQKFVRSINSLASLHLKNAKKVYEFIRDIAEKHLGKTYLIRIPKQCNLNYANEIQIRGQQLQVNDLLTGPYGFRPIPINSDISQIGFDYTLSNYQNLLSLAGAPAFEHYIDNDNPYKYTYGALKCNFNPINEMWEFNYKPEPQGGFFNYSLYDRNLSFSQFSEIVSTKHPFAQAQLLAPIDLTNFEENSRIKAYVRFDHSEFLDLSSIGKENVAQQTITAEGFVPDILEEINNINIDSRESFRDVQKRLEGETKSPSVAFVTCEIDTNFYLLPKLQKKTVEVFGRTFNYYEVPHSPTIISNTDINGCVTYEAVTPPNIDMFTVPLNGGTDGTFVERLDFVRYYSPDYNSEVVDTEKENLNPDYVYAVITLPGRVIPSVDQRYLDGPYQAMNGVNIKHIMCVDVVRGAPGFDQPAPFTNSVTTKVNCSQFTFEQLTQAQKAQKDTNDQIGFANPVISIGFSQPSPVYPDLVALPLMSMERCYGPWISSSVMNGSSPRIRYSDIGGKVEFVKDENLAPWNYAGYQLMNEAGALQAQFSNSLLLFSERGGFVVPDLPIGLVLAQPLGGYGPLITSISLNIDTSVRTTVRMDLYTSRFGKLQKQKEEAIATMVRERQKIIDQNNKMIRNGILRRSSTGYNLKETLDAAGGNAINNLKLIQEPITQIVLSNNEKTQTYSNGQTVTTRGTSGSLQRAGDPEAAGAAFGNFITFSKKLMDTAGAEISQIFTPASEVPNKNMTSFNPIHPQTIAKILGDITQ